MIKFKLITPEKLVLEGEAKSIICPGSVGELGFLPSHAPLLTTLGKGKLRINQEKEQKEFEIENGFCEVLPHQVTILVDKIQEDNLF
ncbi:MAG: ATP synthase F1 subunit epsilon [bacterium]